MNHEPEIPIPIGISGAERTRTADPYLAKVVLSQLSYCPMNSVHGFWFMVDSKNQKQNHYNDFAKESNVFLKVPVSRILAFFFRGWRVVPSPLFPFPPPFGGDEGDRK